MVDIEKGAGREVKVLRQLKAPLHAALELKNARFFGLKSVVDGLIQRGSCHLIGDWDSREYASRRVRTSAQNATV